MDVCERCGGDLGVTWNGFLRCQRCGCENDAPVYEFDCGTRGSAECEWCEERLCRRRAALAA